MDLYSDLPPTKDGSATTVASEQIHLLKQPELAPSNNPPPHSHQPERRSLQSDSAASTSSKSPGHIPVQADATKEAAQAETKPLFMKPRQLNKALTPNGLQKPRQKSLPAQSDRNVLGHLRDSAADRDGNGEGKIIPVETKKGRMHTITWTVEDVDDEYDPSEPNNYELYLETRLRNDQQAASKRNIDRQVKEQEDKRKKLAETRKREAVMSRGDSHASAGAGRGRGRSLLVPAWMKPGKDKAGPTPGVPPSSSNK